MYRVRILVDGFVMGTTAYPKGSEMEVNLPVYNYLVEEKKAELVDDSDPTPGTYQRRDMQAEKPASAPEPKTKRRGRPPGARNKRKKAD